MDFQEVYLAIKVQFLSIQIFKRRDIDHNFTGSRVSTKYTTFFQIMFALKYFSGIPGDAIFEKRGIVRNSN